MVSVKDFVAARERAKRAMLDAVVGVRIHDDEQVGVCTAGDLIYRRVDPRDVASITLAVEQMCAA